MASDCDTFPDRLCIVNTPGLTELQSLKCGCAFVHTCETTTWDGELVRVGRCRYSWRPREIQPCFNDRYVYPTLTRSGANTWELKWDCFDIYMTPITIWAGTRSGSGPVGNYTRTSGCDVRSSYSVEACPNPHTLLVANLDTWSEYNGLFTLDSTYSIDANLIPTVGDSGWNVVKVGSGASAIWTVSNYNITISCNIEVDCASELEVDCAEGLTEVVQQPVQWKQRFVSGSAIGRYKVVPVCEEWTAYRDELVGVSITID